MRFLAWSFLERRAEDRELNPAFGRPLWVVCLFEAGGWGGKWEPKLKVRLEGKKTSYFVKS